MLEYIWQIIKFIVFYCIVASLILGPCGAIIDGVFSPPQKALSITFLAIFFIGLVITLVLSVLHVRAESEERERQLSGRARQRRQARQDEERERQLSEEREKLLEATRRQEELRNQEIKREESEKKAKLEAELTTQIDGIEHEMRMLKGDALSPFVSDELCKVETESKELREKRNSLSPQEVGGLLSEASRLNKHLAKLPETAKTRKKYADDTERFELEWHAFRDGKSKYQEFIELQVQNIHQSSGNTYLEEYKNDQDCFVKFMHEHFSVIEKRWKQNQEYLRPFLEEEERKRKAQEEEERTRRIFEEEQERTKREAARIVEEKRRIAEAEYERYRNGESDYQEQFDQYFEQLGIVHASIEEFVDHFLAQYDEELERRQGVMQVKRQDNIVPFPQDRRRSEHEKE